MYIDRARLAIEVEAPSFLQDLLAAEDEAAVFGEGEEKVKFLRAQADGPGRKAHFPSGGVDEQVTDVDWFSRIRSLSFAAPQNRFDARNKFAWVERLGQVIIRAELEAEDLINIFVAGGEHQNGGGILRSAQSAADFKTIQFREHEVQHNERRMFTRNRVERGFSIAHGLNAKTFAFEVQARQLDDGWFVIDEKDEVFHGGGRSNWVIGNLRLEN